MTQNETIQHSGRFVGERRAAAVTLVGLLPKMNLYDTPVDLLESAVPSAVAVVGLLPIETCSQLDAPN